MSASEDMGTMYQNHDYPNTQLQHLPGSKIRTGQSIQDVYRTVDSHNLKQYTVMLGEGRGNNDTILT